MVPGGNKAECLSSVNHTTKAIHHSNAETMVKFKGTLKKHFPSDFQSTRCELLNVKNLVENKLWANEKKYRYKRIKQDSTVSYLALIKKP